MLLAVDALPSLAEVQAFMDMVPFNRMLGLRVEQLQEGYARMAATFREELIGDPFRRAIHGGFISAMIDTVGGAAVWTRCDPGDRLSTVDLRVDYLRPGLPEDLVCAGSVLRLGNRVGVASMSAYHPGKEAEPVAVGIAVYNVRRSSESR